jgi:hypothetical protein
MAQLDKDTPHLADVLRRATLERNHQDTRIADIFGTPTVPKVTEETLAIYLVVYTTAADNSLNPKTRYNVPLPLSSAGALPWYQPSCSTNSVSWRWCASS